MHDVAANLRYIHRHSNGRAVAYIGHSNGAAQGLAALSSMPELQKLTCHMVALSPAAFVNEFESKPLQFMAWLHSAFPRLRLMSLLFGRRAFFSFMEPTRSIVGIRLFSYMAFCCFNFLFKWGDDHWHKPNKFMYFAQTPAGTSTKTIMHWLQLSCSKDFARYDFGTPQLNRQAYGTDAPPSYPLHAIATPVTIVAGGQDFLLDTERLRKALPNVVDCLVVPHHQHMDNLNAHDAHGRDGGAGGQAGGQAGGRAGGRGGGRADRQARAVVHVTLWLLLDCSRRVRGDCFLLLWLFVFLSVLSSLSFSGPPCSSPASPPATPRHATPRLPPLPLPQTWCTR